MTTSQSTLFLADSQTLQIEIEEVPQVDFVGGWRELTEWEDENVRGSLSLKNCQQKQKCFDLERERMICVRFIAYESGLIICSIPYKATRVCVGCYLFFYIKIS